jgi:hypothetical protein
MNYVILSKSDKTIERIIEFFSDNPNPPDKKIHALAEKLKINPHKFEGMIYGLLSDIINFPKVKESEVNAKELAMGVKVEMEHTSYPSIAKQIALSHLKEIEDYYTRLKNMEIEAKRSK